MKFWLAPLLAFLLALPQQSTTGGPTIMGGPSRKGGSSGIVPIAQVGLTTFAGGPNGGTTGTMNSTGATLLVAWVVDEGAITVSDSKSNTWTALTAGTTGGISGQFFYVANPTVGSGHTCTLSGSSSFSTIVCAAYSNVVTTSPFDQETGAVVAGTSLATGSLTPAANNSLIVTGYGGAATGTTGSVDSGFTLNQYQAGLGGNYGAEGDAYLVQTTAAAINPTWTITPTGNMVVRMAIFKHN
jgi:hypothetical protein